MLNCSLPKKGKGEREEMSTLFKIIKSERVITLRESVLNVSLSQILNLSLLTQLRPCSPRSFFTFETDYPSAVQAGLKLVISLA